MAGTAELAIILKGKDQASGALRGVGTGLNNMAQKARMAGMALSAMGGAIMGVLGMSIKTFVQMGDEVQKMALRTGFATETLSELRHAAQISGSSLASLEKGVKRMQRTIIEANDGLETYLRAFRHIGLEVENLMALSPEDQFWAIAEAIGSLEDPTKRAAVAQQILGRAGTELLPLFAEGKKGMKELREEAHRLGIVFDQEAANKAAEMNDALTRMKESVQGLKMSLAETLIPSLISFVDKIVAIITRINEWTKAHPVLWSWIVKIIAVVGLLGVTIGPILILLPMLVSGFAMLSGFIFSTMIPALMALISAVWAGVVAWLAYLAAMGPVGWAFLATAGVLIGMVTKQIADYIRKTNTATKANLQLQVGLDTLAGEQRFYTEEVHRSTDATEEQVKVQEALAGATEETASAYENLTRQMKIWLAAFPKGIPGAALVGKWGPAWALPAGTPGRLEAMAEYAGVSPGLLRYPELYPKEQQAIVGYQPPGDVYLDGEKVGEIISQQQGSAYAEKAEMGG